MILLKCMCTFVYSFMVRAICLCLHFQMNAVCSHGQVKRSANKVPTNLSIITASILVYVPQVRPVESSLWIESPSFEVMMLMNSTDSLIQGWSVCIMPTGSIQSLNVTSWVDVSWKMPPTTITTTVSTTIPPQHPTTTEVYSSNATWELAFQSVPLYQPVFFISPCSMYDWHLYLNPAHGNSRTVRTESETDIKGHDDIVCGGCSNSSQIPFFKLFFLECMHSAAWL